MKEHIKVYEQKSVHYLTCGWKNIKFSLELTDSVLPIIETLHAIHVFIRGSLIGILI